VHGDVVIRREQDRGSAGCPESDAVAGVIGLFGQPGTQERLARASRQTWQDMSVRLLVIPFKKTV